MSQNQQKLAQKVEQLEQDVEQLQDRHTVADSDGREWSVTGLVEDVGLTRRQAIAGIGLIAAGMSAPQAIFKAVGTAEAQTAGGNTLTGIQQIGEDGDRVQDLYVDTVNSLTEQSALTSDVDGAGYDLTDLGSVDADSLPSTYGVSINPQLTARKKFAGTFGQRSLKPVFQLVEPVNKSVTMTTFVTSNDADIYVASGAGSIEHVATAPDAILDGGDPIKMAAPAPYSSDWLLITNKGTYNTAYIYDSPTDIENDNRKNEHAVIKPLEGGLSTFLDGATRGWIWGEYVNDGADTSVRRITAAGGNMTTPLTAPDVDHFHSVDHDLHNNGTIYALSGDTDSESRFYRSTDFGESFTEVAGGSQKWRSLGIQFTEDYLYWGTDGMHNGASRLYRAERSDISGTAEEIMTVSERDFIWGTCLSYYPRGIVVGVRYEGGGETVTHSPLRFWDIEEQEAKTLDSIPVDQNLAERAGFRWLLSYQDMQRGKIYGNIAGLKNAGGTTSSNVEISIKKLQNGEHSGQF